MTRIILRDGRILEAELKSDGYVYINLDGVYKGNFFFPDNKEVREILEAETLPDEDKYAEYEKTEMGRE